MKYDIIFTNGKIFTSDTKKPYAEAMAVKNGRIAFIGSMEELKGEAGSDLSSCADEVCDLGGKRMLPGLIDSHMHPVMIADNMSQIVCLPPYIHSIEEMIPAIAAKRAEQGPDKWILGWGYDEGKLAEGRTPTRYDLDKGASDVPVCIFRSCGHIRCVNSKALALAGITAETPDPEGGEIERDENGEPTGVLKENARLIMDKIIPAKTREEVTDSIVDLSRLLASLGITGMSDMGNLDDTDYYDIYMEAREKGMVQKIGMFYMWDSFSDKSRIKLTPERMDPHAPVKVQGVKLINDGGISGRTAWVDKPYPGGDGKEQGINTCTEENMVSAMEFAKSHGAQLSVHAMGQNAIDMAVSIISREKDWLMDSDTDMPHARIEHASMPTPYALKAAAAADIAFVTQPVFMYAEIERYLENLGREWLQATFPMQDILKAKIRMAFSTDAPATPLADAYNPFICIKSAVTRIAGNGYDCGQKQAVDIETAIRLYTAEGAYVMGFADTGMLKKGYKADFIVLDRDILKIPAEDIDKVRVESTYADGKEVYRLKDY